MTIRELIENLEQFNPDATVIFWNPDSETLESVTGFLYGGKDNTVELCNDDPT